MAGLVIGSLIVGFVGSSGMAIFNEEWAERWPIAQVLVTAYTTYRYFPNNLWAVAASAAISFVGWLLFLLYKKRIGR